MHCKIHRRGGGGKPIYIFIVMKTKHAYPGGGREGDLLPSITTTGANEMTRNGHKGEHQHARSIYGEEDSREMLPTPLLLLLLLQLQIE